MTKPNTTQFAIALFALIGVACSSAVVRVMPGDGGINSVVARDRTRDGAEEAANDGATKYCKDKGKEAIFTKNEAKYTGSMDENTRNTVNKASNAAMMVGGVMGTSHNEGAGAVLGTAGIVGHSMTSDRDYEAQVTFKCQ